MASRKIEPAMPQTMKRANPLTIAARRQRVEEEKARATAEAGAEKRQEEDRNEEDAVQDTEEDAGNVRRDADDDKSDQGA